MHIYTRIHMRMFCFPQQFWFKVHEKTNADRNPIAQSAMAPKLVDVSSLGALVQQANGNYRVRAQVDGKKYQGPKDETSTSLGAIALCAIGLRSAFVFSRSLN